MIPTRFRGSQKTSHQQHSLQAGRYSTRAMILVPVLTASFAAVVLLGVYQVNKGGCLHQLNSSHMIHSLALIDQLKQSQGYALHSHQLRTTINRIREQPVACLRVLNAVDRSLVGDMSLSNRSCNIVASILSMAKAMSMEVIAEGVETENDLAALRALGCNYAQGYLFQAPRPAAEIRLSGCFDDLGLVDTAQVSEQAMA